MNEGRFNGLDLLEIQHTKDMANNYEERLGTDRMLPLIFRMALPAVAAQIVNLLYNIVDRIYIGHIPTYGSDALAGIGVTGSIIMLISACSAFVGAVVHRWLLLHWDRATVSVRKNCWEMVLCCC